MPLRRMSGQQLVRAIPLETTIESRTRASLLLAAGDPANQKARAKFAVNLQRRTND